MIIANVRVNLSSAETLSCASIPKNAVGLKVRFQYADPLWNKLSKTAVFRNGTKTLNSILTDDCAIIPHELLCKTKDSIYVGLYGTDANQSLAIPTVWAKLGEVSSSATPSSSATSEATLPHWAQIQEKVEFLEREMMIQEDLNRALEQAKESGTFDGPQGPKGAQGDRGEVGPAGYTPVAGVDYWTSKDKQAISTEAANIAASAIQHSSDIICTATGSSICLDEASNRELHGLKLYGKTTQNGTPTPDVPVPLESVGANGSVDVTVCGKNLVDSTNLSWRTTLPTNSDSQSLDCKLSAGKYVFSIKTNIGTARSNTLSATLIDTNNQNIMQINRGSSNSINGTSAFFLTKEDAERVAKLNLYYNYSGDSSPNRIAN